MTTAPSTLRNVILAAWSSCRNDAQRGEVLRAFGGAVHEIMIERFPNETRLREAIGAFLSQIDGILLDQIIIPSGPPHSREGAAPMAALGGTIDVELGRRAERRGMANAEFHGVHAERWHAAVAARGRSARPMDGFTCYVEPVKPSEIRCDMCGAGAGVACMGVERRTV